MKSADQYSRQSGSITLIFCLITTLLTGAISTSLYLGYQVKNKVELQNSNDAAAIAMSSHVAQGLNMISSNNLAIAASLHIAGSFAILSSYLSFVYIFTADGASAIVEALNIGASAAGAAIGMQLDFANKFQDKVWNQVALLPASFVQAATGLTTLNDFLKDYWLAPTPLYGAEILRTNSVGALNLSFQGGQGATPFTMSYTGMRKTSPKETFCRTIASSRELPDRDNLSQWLAGPILAVVGDQSAVTSITNFIGTLESFMQSVSPAHLGFMRCGFGMKTSLAAYLNALQDLVLGVAGDFGAFVGGGLQGALSEVPGIGDQMESIRGHAGETKINLLFSSFWAWLNVGCHGLWETSKVAGAAKKQIELVGYPKKFTKRAMMYTTIRGLKEQRSGASCTSDQGELEGHIPIPTTDGGQWCLDINAIDERCVYKDAIMAGNGVNCSGPKDRLRDWERNGCAGYDAFMNAPATSTSADFGISVADWGKQAETFAKGKGIFTYRDSDVSSTLGFLVPDLENDGKEFLDSLDLLSIATLPTRFSDKGTSIESCPDDLKMTHRNGTKSCHDPKSVALGQLGDLSNTSSDDQVTAAINKASGGAKALLASAANSQESHQAAMRGTWARSQWVFTESHVNYYGFGNDPSPTLENKLFWPAWQARLGGKENNLIRDGLSSVGAPPWLSELSSTY